MGIKAMITSGTIQHRPKDSHPSMSVTKTDRRYRRPSVIETPLWGYAKYGKFPLPGLFLRSSKPPRDAKFCKTPAQGLNNNAHLSHTKVKPPRDAKFCKTPAQGLNNNAHLSHTKVKPPRDAKFCKTPTQGLRVICTFVTRPRFSPVQQPN